ncbi:protein FAR1-RELATED SEQUENCE 5-like [Humulus lupulus]|uniref:protein FAR1-RELATED SEQUENCE 5-like n=1 Tax=Humulus lupulus TaxID=3486 RepID=UPI002B410E59|nr:protein FAR1-RELATED SEQUENCE 5-like [Humulus lupulus]
MNNKPPKVVVTDKDLAMENAIQSVMPYAVHRLCAWHLQNNVYVNAPYPSFKKKFNELLYQYCTEEEFKAIWTSMISDFNFEDKRWVSQTYNNRKSWAECFLRGSFFGGFRTTQRSESINFYLSYFHTSKLKLKDLVSQVDKATQGICYTEREDDFISNHTSLIFPSNVLHQYYQKASIVLTRNIYEKVATQITSALAYSINSIEVAFEYKLYSLTHFPKGLVRSRVRNHNHDGPINCTCMLFESVGIPCRHIFAVLKHLNPPCIPETLFKERWKKDAKNIINLNTFPHSRVPGDVFVSNRWGTLTSQFNAMWVLCYKAE